MIRNRDIVVVGLQPWDISIGSNCKDIALEFSKCNRVLYVNPPLDRKTRLLDAGRDTVRKRERMIRGEEDNLLLAAPDLWTLYPKKVVESINWISSRFLFDKINYYNNIKFASEISDAIERLGMKNVILFNDQSMIRSYYLRSILKPELFVYYIRDNLEAVPYFRKHAIYLEKNLIREADVVVTNSEFLADKARKYNPGAIMVGQGCDFTVFQDQINNRIPDSILALKRPVIGYAGSLNASRLDISLLTGLANSHPDWQIVLVGPEDETFRKSELHSKDNVHFYGSCKPSELPGIISGFDVAINPQLINELTIGNYPRKIDEYLFMGKPVVATRTPFMDYFSGYCYLATGINEFKSAVEQALKDNSLNKEMERKSFALSHSWGACVERISHLIEEKSGNRINKYKFDHENAC